MTGRFISIEGGEGVGKSTQIEMLVQALSERGIACLATREPGGSAGAELIRNLLLDGEVGRWSAGPEALLFAAARGDHVEKTIRPALAKGEWVICDRFIDSSRAYQGTAGHLGDETIMTLHQIGSGGLMPDRTLVLTLGEGEGRARAHLRDAGKGDRFEKKDDKYHAIVEQSFIEFVKMNPDRLRLIDAAGSPEQVHRRVLDAIAGV
ncbi:MAG: dTMP kinase [Sphingomonadales bacterium]|nr:dTMP kinase [Sphingomonadales bacterium]